MAREKTPVTAAIRFLRQHKVDFQPHLFDYVERGGAAHSSAELCVPIHQVIKTLVMEDPDKKPLIVLMHGELEVSTKELARVLTVRQVTPCDQKVAERHSGYKVGGTSPFGLRKAMPIYMQQTIADLASIHINGGRRGFLVSLDPSEIVRTLNPTLVQISA